MELNGKKIIITGGAGGIGSATTKVLLDKGAIVGIVDYNKEKLTKLRDSISLLEIKLLFLGRLLTKSNRQSF